VVALSLAAPIASAALSPAIAEDIVLTLTSGPGAGESLQTWTGGTSPYQLHRSDQPSGVVAPAHLLGLTSSGASGLTDPATPAEGSAFFYVVVSGICGDGVVDLNEGCDDGGVLPGDGCSATCQIETPAALALTPGSEAFGTYFVGTSSPAAPFQLANQGDMNSGALAIGLATGDTGDFAIPASIAGDCVPGAALAGHASCVVRTVFAPQAPGPKSATLGVSATPGGSQQATLSGLAQWPLTLDIHGSGAVTRDGSPACVGTCPETKGYADGVTVTFVATPQNNSNSFFSGWSGDCAGPERTCTVTMTKARSVTATFSPMNNNLAFVSSASVPPTLGSVTAYDAQCNTLATAAGLNNAGGNAYIAWISLPLMSAQARLGVSAQGWVRVDGRPFATTQTSLLSSGVVYHPLRLDEYGVDVGSRLVMTGTSNDGLAQSTCFNWSSNSVTVFMTTGDAASGSGGWSGPSTSPCSSTASIYCLMKTKTATLTITPEAGKRIYLSGNYIPALGTPPDQRCALDKPAGLGTVKALVATTSSSAASVLSPAQRYVRMDGVFIGTGADLAAGDRLTSGMWQTGAGLYAGDSQLAWTGAATPTDIGTSASTCSNWTSTATTARVGRVASTDTAWWNLTTQACSASATRLYCIEQ
jgi:cysteine-rich repeat protein